MSHLDDLSGRNLTRAQAALRLLPPHTLAQDDSTYRKIELISR
jgi:hypothetical protein